MSQALFGGEAQPLRLGRFELRDRLGAGAMGVVYTAYDPTLDREVALKTVKAAGLAASSLERAHARLLREAQALGRLRHPNVVAVYEAGEAEDLVYLVMERLRGETLRAWASREPDWRARLGACLQAGRGLAAAHAAGLVHRDFKPDNVLVGEGVARVIDFGLARAEDARTLTETGQVLGTPRYMAAEQLRGEVVDARCDQFAFCATVYELVYERQPFAGDTLAERLSSLESGPRPPPAAEVPALLGQALCRGLLADPEARHPSMEALLEQLESALSARIGSRIADRFVLGELIGGGGAGVVHRAHDEREDRPVAIKLLRSDRLGDATATRRLEAEAAALVDVPGVPSLLASGATPEGGFYLAMELVEGPSLREALLSEPDRPALLSALAGVARTLAEVHRRSLVHSDVSSSNVLCGPEGMVLIDFGASASTGSRVTAGTPGYLAPERLRGGLAEPAWDQWALAVLAHEIAIGGRPWGQGAPEVVHTRVLEGPARISPRLGPRGLAGVLRRALSPKPEARYPDLEAFAVALERVARRSWRRRPLWPAAAVVAVAATMVALGWPEPGPLAAPEARLACPILEAEGVRAPTEWLGAAAGSLLCRRGRWHLGGGLERTLPPAALLERPRNTSMVNFPFEGQRAASLKAARAKGDVVLDGRVLRRPEGFSLQLRAEGPEGLLLASTEGEGRSLNVAAQRALTGLIEAGVLPPARALDPEVSAATGFADAKAGLAHVDLEQALDTLPQAGGLCATAEALGTAGRSLWETCGGRALGSSPPPAKADAKALRRARQAETSALGRAEVALREARAWVVAGEGEAAHAAWLVALQGEPTRVESLLGLHDAVPSRSSALSGARLAVAWAPDHPWSWLRLATAEPDCTSKEKGCAAGLAVKAMRRATELAPAMPLYPLQLAYRLVHQGRAEEARALQAQVSDGPDLRFARAYIGAMVDLSEARFGRAIERLAEVLETAESLGDGSDGALSSMMQLIRVAEVVDQEAPVADRLAKHFVLGPTPRLSKVRDGDHAMIAVCMRASSKVAMRCLRGLEQLREPGLSSGPPGTDALFEGALHYAQGQTAEAARAWRQVATRPAFTIQLPLAAFAGDPDFAHTLDTGWLGPDELYAGVHPAYVREALRLADAGDWQAAEALARQVIEAWEYADVTVAAVARMRALLRRERPE